MFKKIFCSKWAIRIMYAITALAAAVNQYSLWCMHPDATYVDDISIIILIAAVGIVGMQNMTLKYDEEKDKDTKEAKEEVNKMNDRIIALVATIMFLAAVFFFWYMVIGR